MVEALTILILSALPLMGSPGPATLSVAASGSAYGVRRSLPYALGLILGTVTVLLLIATGVTGALLAVPGLLPVISIAALGYILYLAYRIATAPVGPLATAGTVRPAFTGGYLLAAANPKAFAAIGAVFSGVTVVADQALLDTAIKVAVLSGVIVVVQTTWLFLGVGLARAMGDPTWGRRINIAFAVALVASVAAVLIP